MTSRPPVNKVSPRLRPGVGSSDPSGRTLRRTGAPAAGKSGAPTAGKGKAKPRTKTIRSGAPVSPPGAPAYPYASGPAGPAKASRWKRAGRPANTGPRSRRPAPGWILAASLLVAAVVVSAFAAVAALRPGVGDGNDAYVDTQATQQVVAAADNALKTVYSYDVKTVDGYKDAVHKVVTGKMRGDFDKFADTTVSAIKQAQSTAQATPDPIGVTLLTGDRAELLVNLTVNATKDGAPQESAAGPIVLHMQKVDGRWLASEIADR